MSDRPVVLATVAARMDSSRLPSKALRRVHDRPLVAAVMDRTSRCRRVDSVVLATTTRAVDDPLADWAHRSGWDCHRGEVDDVAARLLTAADEAGADVVVRVNGDCPFTDATLMDQGIDRLIESDAELVTNIPGRKFPYGISVEVFRAALLRRWHPRMNERDREHVTAAFYRDLDCETPTIDYRVLSPPSNRSSFPASSRARLVVDTPEDYSAACRLAETVDRRCGKPGGWIDVPHDVFAQLQLQPAARSA